jgi:hypothetical protein
MLRFHTPTGSIEASAMEEQRVRGLSDWALCHELNTSPQPDLFAVAVLKERPHIRFVDGHGWHAVQ